MPIYGRVIRGKCDEDFLTLSGESHERKVVMVTDQDGLRQCEGKSGRQILQKIICYTDDYIDQKVAQGCEFKLVQFEADTAHLATWKNAVWMAAQAYPLVKSLLYKHEHGLAQMPFGEIEKQAGYFFEDVEQVGKSDPRFMTAERLANSEGALIDVRAFMFFTINLHGNFRGDGHTGIGNRIGVKEYFMSSAPLSTFRSHSFRTLTI